MGNSVSHPDHYNTGGIEVIKAIEAWGFGEGFNRGNAIKYIARAGHKDAACEIQDLKKAIQYLEFEIERLEGQGKDEDDLSQFLIGLKIEQQERLGEHNEN